MAGMLMRATSGDISPQTLRARTMDDGSPEMNFRRGIVVASLVGIGSMALVSLLQTGVVRRLPDPPAGRINFDTRKVNTSDEAFSYGMPDGPLVVASHAANIVLAAAGPGDRRRERPWIPLLASIVSGGQAAIAAKYLFYQMPRVDKAWCPYCVVDALTHFATFALTLPESVKTVRGDRR